MTFAELDGASVLLRTMTYAGSIAAAGSVLFSLTMGWVRTSPLVRRQLMIGAILLIICEPLRYGMFQLSIAQGDVALAFDPSMRWLGLETPIGQASLARLAGLGVVLAGLAGFASLASIGALTMVGSFLFEGHTASSEERYLLMPLLFLHLLVAHWWLAALMPLRAMLGRDDIPIEEVAGFVDQFGRQALVAVGILVGAGAFLLASLVGWQFALSKAYQQGFLIKLGAFLLILQVAAINRLRLTPLLSSRPEAGRAALRRSISIEIAIAAAILAATAIAISFPPMDH